MREGRTDRTGKRKLGVHVIYTNLQEHFPVLEKMNGGERRTSFGEWAAQHIRKVENPKAEVKLKSIRQFYGDWCKTSGLHPASNRAIFHHLTQQGFESYIDWQDSRRYRGTALIGLDGLGHYNKTNKAKG